MISRQSTEGTEKISTPRRSSNRRGLKKRSILPSFGDIVLPVVSIAAVGLLVLAGRQFFINGMKTSPGITSTRAYADSPALLAERANVQSQQNDSVNNNSEPTAVKTDNESGGYTSENRAAPPLAEVKPIVRQSDKNDRKTTPAVQPKKAEPQKKAAPTQAVKRPDPPKNNEHASVKASSLPANKQWRVQTSSHPTKKSAEEAVKKINRAGFKATVYKNPESKYYKVWVQGGESKYQAGLVVNAMKKLGYKTSFAFPPAK